MATSTPSKATAKTRLKLQPHQIILRPMVTEKGLLGDLRSGKGNRLSRASLSLDLNDPQLCEDIQRMAEDAVAG